jgi:hypothetical protein
MTQREDSGFQNLPNPPDPHFARKNALWNSASAPQEPPAKGIEPNRKTPATPAHKPLETTD